MGGVAILGPECTSGLGNNAEVLRIATEKMEESGLVEWPSARSAAKTLGLWTLSLIPTPANPAALK